MTDETDMAAQPSSVAAPLAGLTLIELGHSVAAPFAGQVLADLGATVIKVENPDGGDDARNWGPPFWEGASATFQSLNRNKASVTLDLKTPKGIESLKGLVQGADILLENMRPGLLQKLGLGPVELRASNPRLIYCSLGAFGSVGPLKDRPGYDPLIQAFSGIMAVTGEPGRPPVRVGPSIIDMGSGLWCVIGILAALLKRRETGEGCVVDVSLYETALSWMSMPIAAAMASGKEPGRHGSETPMLAPYRAYQAQDTHVVIAAGNDNLFRRLSEALQRPEWGRDPRFATNADRVANREALNDAIAGVIQTRPSAHWTELLSEVGVPCAATQTVSEVIAHPQTEALKMISKTPDGRLRLVRTPIRLDGVRPAIRGAPPALGADNLRLLADDERRE